MAGVFLEGNAMIRKDHSGKVITNLGYLLCDKCNGEGRPDDIQILVDSTYADDPCDDCGHMGIRRKNDKAE